MNRTTWRHGVVKQVVFVLLACGAYAVQATIPASERTVLLNLYTSTNGAGWTNSTNWNGAPGTECTWFGITCDGTYATVTAIFLSGNNLTGSLPSDLNNLPNLTFFSAHFNQLTGSIPALNGLTKLEFFYVNDNLLTGSIPSLTGLTKLQFFYVDHNQLTGSIPALAGLTSMFAFRVENNHLTGTIPDLSGLTNLRFFSGALNQLTGSIPSLAGLTDLAEFVVWSNQLTGAIPSLAGLTNLGSFVVSDNQLTGAIPSLTGLPNMDRFYLDHNQLTGSIPDLSGLPNLREFDVRGNLLSGSIPALTGLTKLQLFYVDHNQLTGSVPSVPSPNALLAGGSGLCPNYLDSTSDPAWDVATGVTPWYTNCPAAPIAVTAAATAITKTGATLNGTVTANGASTTVIFEFGSTSAYDTIIGATQSPLPPGASGATVSVPISGLSCSTLYHFHVTATNGTGGIVDGGDLTFTTVACNTTIPASERAALLNLYTSTNGGTWYINTNWNGAVGTECTWFGVTCNGAESTVTGIGLGVNNLTGSLPNVLSDLPNLTIFVALGNQLTGSIPTLAGSTNLQTLSVGENQLTGSIPALTGLTALQYFSVHNNQLTGSIPALTGLAALEYFLVHDNQLTGSIPALTALTNLKDFDASSNQLTGSVPAFTGLTNLDTFWASNNQLTGFIPDLSGLPKLRRFDVEGNDLSGSIPSLSSLTSLVTFFVQSNQLTGSIPALTGLTKLQIFDVSFNQLSGSIPALTGLTELNVFSVGHNQLTGQMPALTGLNLSVFAVENNRLTGNVPSVPVPSSLAAGASSLCPNFLNHTPAPAWDTATGVKPWYTNCISAPPVLDVDVSANVTTYDALTDGLLVIRYLFGMTGSSLTNGALGGTATRTDPAIIKSYLDAIRSQLDIDGNGSADALTDGLLIIRYLFGLRGSALIANALDPLATRKTATEIETYIQTLMP